MIHYLIYIIIIEVHGIYNLIIQFILQYSILIHVHTIYISKNVYLYVVNNFNIIYLNITVYQFINVH